MTLNTSLFAIKLFPGIQSTHTNKHAQINYWEKRKKEKGNFSGLLNKIMLNNNVLAFCGM